MLHIKKTEQDGVCHTNRVIMFGAMLLTFMTQPAKALPWTLKSGVTMFTVYDPNKLSARVNLRVTHAELEQLREDADMAGLSLSELVRRRYFGRPIITRSDDVTIRELRRLGGLLKHLHNESDGNLTKDYGAALKHVAAAIERLAKPA